MFVHYNPEERTTHYTMLIENKDTDVSTWGNGVHPDEIIALRKAVRRCTADQIAWMIAQLINEKAAAKAIRKEFIDDFNKRLAQSR